MASRTKISEWYSKVLEVIVATLVGSIVLAVSGQIFARFLLNRSFTWTEELARILMVWLTFLGAALAVRRQAHIRVDFADRLLPPRFAFGLNVALHILMLAFLVVLLAKGPGLIRSAHTVRTPALSVPTSFIHAAPWVGTLAMLPYLLNDALRLLATIRTRGRGGRVSET